MKRSSGVLLPVASLPSKYGIGCFDRCAYDFVDQLVYHSFLRRRECSHSRLSILFSQGHPVK